MIQSNYSDESGLLKAFVVGFRTCSESVCSYSWLVSSAPDPEEDSSGDGAGRFILFDVESAVKNLGPGCKKFFGRQFLNDAASFALGITVVDSRGPQGNNRIPGLDQTFAQYLDSSGSTTVAVVVQSYIVIGANFAVPFQTIVRDSFLSYYGNRLGAWQRDALFHEFMHIFTGMDDVTMATNWKKRGADLGDISTRDKASQEMFLFAARDCKKKEPRPGN